jgi:hypothetical protein
MIGLKMAKGMSTGKKMVMNSFIILSNMGV